MGMVNSPKLNEPLQVADAMAGPPKTPLLQNLGPEQSGEVPMPDPRQTIAASHGNCKFVVTMLIVLRVFLTEQVSGEKPQHIMNL
jgi:hypothetical protein